MSESFAELPGDNSHVLPVIGELFTAIEANNVRACPPRGQGTTSALPDAHRETQVFVPAAEQQVNKVRSNWLHGNSPPVE
jgi:hypothetical protein